jgi:carbon-monoxide dehydrogenase medium subunit
VTAALADGDAAIVSGGMSHALRRERTGYPQTKRLIAVGRIVELNELSVDPSGVLRAGAAVRLQTMYDDARVTRNWQALEDALEAIGHTRVRRGITVGGSIGPLIGGFDLPVALLALETRVTVAGPQGRRVVALPELYAQRLARAEMVVGIEVEPLPARSGSSFLKYMARNVLEIPTVNTAACVSVDAGGRCSAARVAIGAVSWKPIVLDLRQLAGQRFDTIAIRQAVQDVRALAEPTADVRGSAAYKREMAVEFAARAIASAWQRAIAAN